MPGGGLATKVWLQDRSGQEMLRGHQGSGDKPSAESLEGTAGHLRLPDPKG